MDNNQEKAQEIARKQLQAKKKIRKMDKPVVTDDGGPLSPSQFAKLSKWEDDWDL